MMLWFWYMILSPFMIRRGRQRGKSWYMGEKPSVYAKYVQKCKDIFKYL